MIERRRCNKKRFRSTDNQWQDQRGNVGVNLGLLLSVESSGIEGNAKSLQDSPPASVGRETTTLVYKNILLLPCDYFTDGRLLENIGGTVSSSDANCRQSCDSCKISLADGRRETSSVDLCVCVCVCVFVCVCLLRGFEATLGEDE